ncbi:uncharacterized protein LOC132708394 isoform X2 [Cylas formicarius]|uniref:uncharacterized protein LOC132708394 isoform X2 n=1 Tax=Cylas formicarius TaxID=197179 RepID=UPI002958526A|nr:uncharacterized protein LOC132708394 isoform X2 [Cylas formicarius]
MCLYTGDIRTSLLAGSKFNVTWHLGYPHKGGFKIQLLDELERPVLELTPSIQGTEFISNDATAQSFQVQLPAEFTCTNCTLRLIRQALEWGSNYRFWSCADVDIKARKNFKESCSGHGRYLLGKCKCDRLYYGPVCQFRDECLEGSDCGDHGVCVDIEATTSPRKQCYCQIGWFGPGCIKRSPVKTSEIDFDLYTKMQLSETFTLHWRILKEHKEIEAIMVVNGTSYAALGWRPKSLTKSCKNFPQIGPVVTKVDSSESKVEPQSEPEPTSEPHAEPSGGREEVKSEPEPEPSSEPEPISEPEPKSEPEPSVGSNPQKRKSVQNRRSASPNPVLKDELEGVDRVETSVSFQVSKRQGRNKRQIEIESGTESASTSEPDSESEPTPQSTFRRTTETSSVPNLEPQFTREPTSEPEPKSEPIAEPEPSSEPEPASEPEPKSEPETNSEPEPEPTSATARNSEPEPNARSEPTSEPNSKAEPEPRNAKLDPKTYATLEVAPKTINEEILNPYTPRHDFNPMDCTDIVIGSARGTASRIADYYTRDRSTPRMDSYWGGKNDLTAVMGFEKDGVTTILFRKKLESKEMSDHSIEEDFMHVIFAQGQEPGNYVHVPKSGIESGQASTKDFYKADELKYHGHKNQRGVISLNFYDEKKAIAPAGAAATSDSAQNTHCGGEWKIPKGCRPENYTCEYSAKWELIPRKDEIRFTITTNHTDTWTGIAFSDNEKMSQTDAILGWVDQSGRPFLMDTWITGYTQPSLDRSQNVYNASGKIVDGVTTLSFSRKRITKDHRDLDFTNEKCLFMMFPVRGGAFNSVNKKIRKHEQVPIVSTERVCIKSCGNDDIYEYQTTTEAPGLDYNIKVKLIELGENFVAPKHGTIEYEDLSSNIVNNIEPVFRKLKGYRRLSVQELTDDHNNIVALMNLQFSREPDKGTSLEKHIEYTEENVHKVIQDSVGSGRIGNLKVDPQYLVFEPQSLTSNIVPDSSTSDQSGGFFDLSSTKFYIVLGCIGALVFVALVQAGCTVYRAMGRGNANSHKDHLIPNSAWKDYSANTNYAFDAFEPEETKNPVNGHGNNGRAPATRPRSNPPRPQGRPPSVPPQAPPGDSRSLQRPRSTNYAPPTDRSTFSLPRTTFDRHTVGPTKGGQMPADFYFMPSQRKYSGEVVRVYVDYNKNQRD